MRGSVSVKPTRGDAGERAGPTRSSGSRGWAARSRRGAAKSKGLGQRARDPDPRPRSPSGPFAAQHGTRAHRAPEATSERRGGLCRVPAARGRPASGCRRPGKRDAGRLPRRRGDLGRFFWRTQREIDSRSRSSAAIRAVASSGSSSQASSGWSTRSIARAALAGRPRDRRGAVPGSLGLDGAALQEVPAKPEKDGLRPGGTPGLPLALRRRRGARRSGRAAARPRPAGGTETRGSKADGSDTVGAEAARKRRDPRRSRPSRKAASKRARRSSR